MRECCVWCVCPCFYCRLCVAVVVVSLMCIGWFSCSIGELCHVVVFLSGFVLLVGCVVSIWCSYVLFKVVVSMCLILPI